MKLHEAIKQVVNESGTSVFDSNVIINILADYGVFQEMPAIKSILKDFIAQGYGSRINEVCKSPNQQSIQIQALKTRFIHDNGYRKELVKYLFDSVLYSLGAHVEEPQYSVFTDINEVVPQDSYDKISDFNTELINLQAEYTTCLKHFYESPSKDSYAAYGFYSAEARSHLWLIEQKIIIIYRALSQEYNNWCELQEKKYIESRAKSRRTHLKERLEDSKNRYISLLSSLLIVPKNLIYSKSGYYNNTSLKTLKDEESVIAKLDKSLETHVLQECLAEKKKILDKYAQSTSKQLFQIVLKVVLPIVVVIVILYNGINYISSSDQIGTYQNNISLGDKHFSERQYMEAIHAYDAASDGYRGTFNYDGYISEALAKRDKACEQLLQQTKQISNRLYGEGEFLKAKNEFENIKAYMTSPELSQKYTSEINRLNQSIAAAVENGRNTIILNIATNKGRLNEQGKKQLNQLLEVAPNDYWLNIISKKQK